MTIDSVIEKTNENGIDTAEVNNQIIDKMHKTLKAFLDWQSQNQLVDSKYLTYLSELWQEFTQQLVANPEILLNAQLNYWQDVIKLLQNNMASWKQDSVESIANEHPTDKRFQYPQWETNPAFKFIKDAYCLNSEHILSLVDAVPGPDHKKHKQIEFYIRQYIHAVSPSNFLATNPELLALTHRSGGENILHGLDNLLSDLNNSSGQFNLKMTDMSSFKIGNNIAVTPGEVIFQNELMQLIQYTPTTNRVCEKPLLIVPPWINKYYILDLNQKKSLVKWAVDQGFTVFMISWVNPDSQMSDHGFDDYMMQGPVTALEVIEDITKVKQVNTLGFCIGGTLLGCTAAYLAKKQQKIINSVTYLATLLDFSSPGELEVFIDDTTIGLLEDQMQQLGYFPGARMAMSFNLLRVDDLLWSFFVNNYLKGQEPFPFDLLYWNADNTNLPAEMFSFYLRQFYLKNQFCKTDGLRLADTSISLESIQCPVYCLATEHDHIAPWQSVYTGVQMHSGPIRFVLAGSGHVAGIVNPPSAHKYDFHTNSRKYKDPQTWLTHSKQAEGSWWPDWSNWLRKHSGDLIDSKQVGSKCYPSLEPAPGSYVLVKA